MTTMSYNILIVLDWYDAAISLMRVMKQHFLLNLYAI